MDNINDLKLNQSVSNSIPMLLEMLQLNRSERECFSYIHVLLF